MFDFIAYISFGGFERPVGYGFKQKYAVSIPLNFRISDDDLYIRFS